MIVTVFYVKQADSFIRTLVYYNVQLATMEKVNYAKFVIVLVMIVQDLFKINVFHANKILISDKMVCVIIHVQLISMLVFKIYNVSNVIQHVK